MTIDGWVGALKDRNENASVECIGRNEMCMRNEMYMYPNNKQTITNVLSQSLGIALCSNLPCGSLLFSKTCKDAF